MSRSPNKNGIRKQFDAFLILHVLLLAATAAAIIKTIFMGNCGDETTTITLACELAGGKQLFSGSYSIHQTSAWMEAPFVKLYTVLTGTVDGMQIFLRVAGVLVQLGAAVCLYLVLRRWISEKMAFLLGILTANFLPKGIQVLEYSTLHVWFEIFSFACLMLWAMEPGKERGKLLLSGFLFALAVLSYPTVIVAFPVYLLAVFLLAKRLQKRQPLLAAVWFGAGAAAALAVFLAYVQATTGIFGENGMLENLPYLLGHFPHSTAQGSHGGGFAGFVERLTAFVSLPTLAALFVISGGILLACKALEKAGAGRHLGGWSSMAVWAVGLAGAAIYLRALIFSWQSCNQFTVFTCLLFTFAAGAFFYALGPKAPLDLALFYLGWVPSWGILLGMYIGSNLEAITTQTPACFIGVLVSCVFLQRFAEARQMRGKEIASLGYVTVLALFLIFSRGVFSRAPRSEHYTIFEPWVQMDVGISKGIWMIPNDVEYYKGLYRAAAPYEKPGDVIAANWLNLGILTQPDVIGGSPYGYTFDSTVFLESRDDPDIFYKESLAFYKQNNRWPDVILVRLWDESFWDTDYYAALKARYTVVRDEEDGIAILLLDGARVEEAVK
jgi:hypothetical protein